MVTRHQETRVVQECLELPPLILAGFPHYVVGKEARRRRLAIFPVSTGRCQHGAKARRRLVKFLRLTLLRSGLIARQYQRRGRVCPRPGLWCPRPGRWCRLIGLWCQRLGQQLSQRKTLLLRDRPLNRGTARRQDFQEDQEKVRVSC